MYRRRPFFRRELKPLKRASDEQPSVEESVLKVLKNLSTFRPSLFPMSGINSFRLTPHLLVPYLFQCAEQETNLTYKRFKSHWRSCGLPFFMPMYLVRPVREATSISPYYQILKYTVRQLLVPQTAPVYTYIIYILFTAWCSQCAIFSSHSMRIIDPRNNKEYFRDIKLKPFSDLTNTESVNDFPSDSELCPTTIPLPSAVWSEWTQISILFKNLAVRVVKNFRESMIWDTEEEVVEFITLDDENVDSAGLDETLSPNLGPMSSQHPHAFSFDLDHLSGGTAQTIDRVGNDRKGFSEGIRKRIEHALQQCGKLRWLARSLGVKLDPVTLQPVEGDDFTRRSMTSDSPKLTNGQDLVLMLRRYNLSARKVKLIPAQLSENDKAVVDVISCLARMHRYEAFTLSFSDSMRPLLGRHDIYENHFGLDPLVTSTSTMQNPGWAFKEWGDYSKAEEVLTDLTIFHSEKRDFMKLKDKLLFPQNKKMGVFSANRIPEDIERNLRKVADSGKDDSPFSVALTKDNIEANMGPVIEPSGISLRKTAKFSTAINMLKAINEMLDVDKTRLDHDASLIYKLQNSMVYDDFPMTPHLMNLIANDLELRAQIEDVGIKNALEVWEGSVMDAVGLLKDALTKEKLNYDVTALDYEKLERVNAVALSLRLIAQCHTENKGELKGKDVGLLLLVLATALKKSAQRMLQALPCSNSSLKLVPYDFAAKPNVNQQKSRDSLLFTANLVLNKLYMSPQFMVGQHPRGLHYRTAILECLNQGPQNELDFPPLLPLASMKSLPHWLSTTCQLDIAQRLREVFAQLDPQWMIERLQQRNEDEDVALKIEHVAEVCGISMDDVKSESDKGYLNMISNAMSKAMKRGTMPSLTTSAISMAIDHARLQAPSHFQNERCVSAFTDVFHGPRTKVPTLLPKDGLSDFAQLAVSGLGAGNAIEFLAMANPFSLFNISSVLDMDELRTSAMEHQAILGGLFGDASASISDVLEKGGIQASLESKDLTTWLTDANGGWMNENEDSIFQDVVEWMSRRSKDSESVHDESTGRFQISPCDWVSEASQIIHRSEGLVKRYMYTVPHEHKKTESHPPTESGHQHFFIAPLQENPLIQPIIRRPGLRALPLNKRSMRPMDEFEVITRIEEDLDEAVNLIPEIEDKKKLLVKSAGANVMQMLKVQYSASIGAFPRPLIPFLPFALSLQNSLKVRGGEMDEKIGGWPSGVHISISSRRTTIPRETAKHVMMGKMTLRNTMKVRKDEKKSNSFLASSAATECLRILFRTQPTTEQMLVDGADAKHEVSETAIERKVFANEEEQQNESSHRQQGASSSSSLLDLHHNSEVLTVVPSAPEITPASSPSRARVSRFLTSEEANTLIEERKQKENEREQTKHEMMQDLKKTRDRIVRSRTKSQRGTSRVDSIRTGRPTQRRSLKLGAGEDSVSSHSPMATISTQHLDPLTQELLQLQSALLESSGEATMNDTQTKRSRVGSSHKTAKNSDSRKDGDKRNSKSRKRLKTDFDDGIRGNITFSDEKIFDIDWALSLVQESIEKGSAIPQEVIDLTNQAMSQSDAHDKSEEKGHEL